MKNAFTLAEVLITLGIIGVVAASTIPNIVKKYRVKVLEAQFKVAYNTIINANNKMYADDPGMFSTIGGPGEEGWAWTRKYGQLLPKYYKVMKYVDKNEFKNTPMYTSNGHAHNYKDKFLIYFSPVILTNGMLITITTTTLGNLCIYFDTNGPYKGPNRYGYDLFMLTILPNGKLSNIRPSDAYCSFRKSAATWYVQGIDCSYWAIRDLNPDHYHYYSKIKKYWEALEF